MNNYMDDSYALHTDLYQINMAESYWEDNIHTKQAVFELYFRSLPFGNGYAIFARLERIIDYLQTFHFYESHLVYFKELGYPKDSIYSSTALLFTVIFRAMIEGESVFGYEPMIRIDTPLFVSHLVETSLFNILNYQTLIA